MLEIVINTSILKKPWTEVYQDLKKEEYGDSHALVTRLAENRGMTGKGDEFRTTLLDWMEQKEFDADLRFSKVLARSEKDRIVRRFYHRYRESVIHHIRERMQENRRVLHISLHSFTPVLNKEKRNADMGILYDPGRKREKAFAISLQNALRIRTGLKIRRNYPYRRSADGFTTA